MRVETVGRDRPSMKRWPPEAVPISQITRGDLSRKKAWNPLASSGSWIIPISFAKMNKAPGDFAVDDCRPTCQMFAAAIRVSVVKRLRLSTAPSLRETMRSIGQRFRSSSGSEANPVAAPPAYAGGAAGFALKG